MQYYSQESQTWRYSTSQTFTLRETLVELSSGKGSHFSWALLGTGNRLEIFLRIFFGIMNIPTSHGHC